MRIRPFTLALVGSLSMAAVACGSAPQTAETTAANDRGTGAAQQSRGTATSGGDTGGGRGCDVSPVYFAFDSSDLDSRARTTLEGNARCLQQRNSGARVTGMTDPRGTEEYNLALGDRRARQATQYMSNMGVDGSRLSVRSAGEEQANGNDESGWAMDRRAEFQIQ
jgi:peptidoglycan-associated lipoprotein